MIDDRKKLFVSTLFQRNDMHANRMYVRSFVLACVGHKNVRLYTANKRLDIEAPTFAHLKIMHVDEIYLPASFHPNRQRP